MLTHRDHVPTYMTPHGCLEMLKSYKSQPSLGLKLGISKGKPGHGQMGREVRQTQESRERGVASKETKPWFNYIKKINISICLPIL